MSILTSKQYLASRRKILADFDAAKDKASAHEIQTYHGCYVEEQIRDWLNSFLPKKYGVCAGYVVSQKLSEHRKHPHFDVIIYDALNAPILWAEEGSTNSKESRAIPAENVLAVFEIKSKLDTTTIDQSLDHIRDLKDVAAGIDQADERYKNFLPKQFFWGLIYIELEKGTPSSKTICEKFFSNEKIRGYFTTFIFRKTGQSSDNHESGKLDLINSDAKMNVGDSFDGDFALIFPMNDYLDSAKNYLGMISSWGNRIFVEFSFDVLAMLNQTYQVGRLSSFYGMELAQKNET